MSPRLRNVLGAVSLVVLGGALTLLVQHLFFFPPNGSQGLRGSHDPGAASAEMVSTLRSELDLTASQADSIETILRRRQKTVNKAWQQVRTRLHAAMDSTQREIEAVLSEVQRRAFRQWLKSRHEGAPTLDGRPP